MRFFLTLFLAVSTFQFAQAQENHSRANLVVDGEKLVSGMRIGIHIDIDPQWHTYWENPGDVGAPPQLDINSTVPISPEDLVYPIPHRIHGEPFDYYGYENEALFYKIISLNSPTTEKSSTLKIRFDWLVCKEICVPCSKTFDLVLPIDQSGKIEKNSHFESFSFPKHVDDIKGSVTFDSTQTRLDISSSVIRENAEVDFFPSPDMNQVFNKAISKQVNAGNVSLVYPITKIHSDKVHGLIKIDAKNAYWIGQTPSASPIPTTTSLITERKSYPKSPLNILTILALALLGGILLNFMPCVLPVASLKILSVLRSNQEDMAHIRKTNLVYALGILTSLLTLAIAFLLIRSGGTSLGWGFQLQSPTFVTFLIVLFFLIGLNLIGFFEVGNLPIPGINQLSNGSYHSEFLGGFFVTLVATPCTAPFMAVAIGYALTQSSAMIIITFLSLGIGLSLPFLLLAIAPSCAKIFPKPGEWMLKMKEFLSFPMFLTVAWLVWVLSQLTQAKAVIFVLFALVLIVFLLWFHRKIFLQRPIAQRIGIFFIVLITAAFLYVPIQLQQSDAITWEAFDPAKVSSYGKNSVTLIDFTADWCITCKANERFAFSNQRVIDTIDQNHIRMVKADWTKQNPDITKILQQYDRAGVPFYLLYKPGLTTPEVLPTLLTPGILIEAFTSKGVSP